MMREWIMRVLRSKEGFVIGLVGLLAVGAIAAAQMADDGEAAVDVQAGDSGPPDLDAVATTAEEAMQTALWVARLANAAEAPPGEPCRNVTVREVREALEANPDQTMGTFDWVNAAPDDLHVWACPLLFPPNGRGMGFVKAEESEFDVGRSTIMGFQEDDSQEPNPSESDDLPPLNEVQTPPTTIQP